MALNKARYMFRTDFRNFDLGYIDEIQTDFAKIGGFCNELNILNKS